MDLAGPRGLHACSTRARIFHVYPHPGLAWWLMNDKGGPGSVQPVIRNPRTRPAIIFLMHDFPPSVKRSYELPVERSNVNINCKATSRRCFS